MREFQKGNRGRVLFYTEGTASAKVGAVKPCALVLEPWTDPMVEPGKN